MVHGDDPCIVDGKDLLLGYDKLEGFLNSNNPFFGATVGRCANRIAKGKFTLNSKEYSTPTNNGENMLHGGDKGFDKVSERSEEL